MCFPKLSMWPVKQLVTHDVTVFLKEKMYEKLEAELCFQSESVLCPVHLLYISNCTNSRKDQPKRVKFNAFWKISAWNGNTIDVLKKIKKSTEKLHGKYYDAKTHPKETKDTTCTAFANSTSLAYQILLGFLATVTCLWQRKIS